MASNLAKVEHVIYNFTLFPLKSECGYVGLILNEITMNVHPLILQFSYNLQGLTTPIQGANAILSYAFGRCGTYPPPNRNHVLLGYRGFVDLIILNENVVSVHP